MRVVPAHLQVQARSGAAHEVRVRQAGDVPVFLLSAQSQAQGEPAEPRGYEA